MKVTTIETPYLLKVLFIEEEEIKQSVFKEQRYKCSIYYRSLLFIYNKLNNNFDTFYANANYLTNVEFGFSQLLSITK